MINQVLELLSVPESCKLNKPVYKKYFMESGLLNTTDKKVLKEDVGKIRWLYTLKPSTINISPYIDKSHDYPEIAVLHVELLSPIRAKRIAAFMQQAIPYPLILLFTCGTSLQISLAEKRLSQASKDKWVIEEHYDSDWIDLEQPETHQALFLKDFSISNFSYRNFFDFYQDIVQRIVALNCAVHTGQYSLETKDTGSTNDRFYALRVLEKLQQQRQEIRNKLKKERNLGTQAELNTQIKQIIDRIDAIKQEL